MTRVFILIFILNYNFNLLANKSDIDFLLITSSYFHNNGKTAVATQFSMINRVTVLIKMIANLKINRNFILKNKSGSEKN